MNANGTIKSAFNVQSVDASYKLAGSGDFDGDGIADLLWRNTSGVNALWDMNANGTIKAAFNVQSVGSNYHMAAIADFDADGRSDLLWRDNSSGVNALWTMNDNGTIKSAFNVQSVGSSYKMVGTGDFNADGISGSAVAQQRRRERAVGNERQRHDQGGVQRRVSIRATRWLAPATSMVTASPTCCGAATPGSMRCGK